MKFSKYHGLGNDYLVIHPEALGPGLSLSLERARHICDRHFGLGADGILLGPLESEACDFGLRIFNSDGTEAEKSGNGLRIFARHLWDEGRVKDQPFTVETAGGVVSCRVGSGGREVRVEMGQVRFDSGAIPVTGEPREVLNEQIEVDGEVLTFCGASVGNPHCVVLADSPTPEDARRFGPLIENDPRFPNRINMQLMKVLDRRNIQIEIWERGCGYTLASGSSSTAAAAVARRLGLCGSEITVHMPGGRLNLQFDDDFRATLIGPVVRVCSGEADEEMFEVAWQGFGL